MKHLWVSVLVLLGSFSIVHAAMPSDEYLVPADTMTIMRSKTVRCYKMQKVGNSNRLTRVAVEGDECPSTRSSLPRRIDRPEQGGEVESPGIPFPRRME